MRLGAGMCRVCAHSDGLWHVVRARTPPGVVAPVGPECALQRRDAMTPGSPRLDSTPHGPSRARTVLVVDADAGRGATTGGTLSRHGYRVLLAKHEADVRVRMATAPVHVLVVGPVDALERQGVIDGVREQDPLVRVVIQLRAGEAAPAPALVDMLALHGWVDA